MSMQKNFFIFGLPQTGKTTLLAALWHVVDSGEVEGSLRLIRLHGDQSHLNRIRALWADVREIGRTQIGSETSCTMILESENAKDEYEIAFPDLSGETFLETMWKERQIKTDHSNQMKNSNGGVLTLHPESIREETLISEVTPIVAQLDKAGCVDTVSAMATDPLERKGEEESWDAKKAPTQVQIVDIIQMLLARVQNHPFPLAVIVSAWDKVEEQHGEGLSPESWVKKRLPLLWQFIIGNNNRIVPRFYGLSAQGGPLEKATELRKVTRPSDRIVIIHDSQRTHDITLPIKWLGSIDEKK